MLKKHFNQIFNHKNSVCEENRNNFFNQLEIVCSILDSQKKSILACDLSYNFLYCNSLAERLLKKNYKNKKVPIWSLFTHHKIEKLIQNAVILELFDKLEDITINDRIISITIDTLVINSKLVGYLINIEDATKERLTESYLRKQENLASVSHIASSVAHEIKNPLASMSLISQLLKRTLTKENLAKEVFDNVIGDIDILDEEIERLNKIIVNYLYTAKPLNIMLERINLVSLVKKTITILKHELETNQIHLSFVQNNDNVFLMLDYAQMKQALINLLQNAINACPKNGKIEISLTSDSCYIYLVIKDNGAGISSEIKDKIFQPYFTTKESGSGLGLMLVYKIIKEHGADIKFNSPPKDETSGSEFIICFVKPQSEKLLTCN